MMCVVDGAENVFDVVIYVPSARENFDQRNAIRETWLGHINQNDTLQNRFAFWYYLCTHTHTHQFNGPLYGTTQVSRYQKSKTNRDFTEARDS